MTTIFGFQKDIFFMNKALHQARKAFALDEVPIGAVLVDGTGTIIARGHNSVESSHSQRYHAEIIVIDKASKKRKDWRLDDCWLYVTLEPCMMCMGLIYLSRLRGVVFGALSPLFGFQLDKEHLPALYKKDTFEVISGVEEKASMELLKRFFQLQRKKRG